MSSDSLNSKSDAEESPDFAIKSKTQLKKEMIDRQKLGEALTACTNKQLNRLPLPDSLRTAINEYNRLPNSYGARKRQAQYIGRVMRDCDFESIKLAMDRLEQHSKKTSGKQPLQRLCDSLLASGDQQITALLTQYPHLERQKLRQLCRECTKAKPEKQQICKDRIIRYLRDEIGDGITAELTVEGSDGLTEETSEELSKEISEKTNDGLNK